jgi:enoyl-CoA hydratase/carnithine racemase
MLYAAVKALDAGFNGLCAAGDIVWVLDEAPGTAKPAEYEARLNRFYKEHRALGLCLHNRRTLPAAVLDHGLATHPVVRVEGPILLSNPFYEEPEAAARRVAQPDRVQEEIAGIGASRTLEVRWTAEGARRKLKARATPHGTAEGVRSRTSAVYSARLRATVLMPVGLGPRHEPLP